MSEKRRNRHRSCHGKLRWATDREATFHLKYLQKHGETSISTYHCVYCHGWHVGHKSKQMGWNK